MWKAYRYTGTRTGSLESLEHIHEVVVDRWAYFPRPSQLNDPIDCRPRMKRPSTVEIETYLSRRSAAKFPGRDARAERKRRKSWARERLQDRQTLQRMWATYAERYGVFSLSRSKCNAHLWNAYGEYGRGVCIEFDLESVIAERVVDWVPFVVEYADVQPEINILEFLEPDRHVIEEFVRRSFRVKTRKWMIEEEVRVAVRVEADAPKIRVPDGVLRALFLGPHMSNEHRQAILSWPTDIEVYSTHGDADGRILGFERLR